MTDDIEQRLTRAAEAFREYELATGRCADLRRRRDELGVQVEVRQAVCADEVSDVDRLESLSVTRVMVSLMGTRTEKLDRERAEADAARLRLAEAQDQFGAVCRAHDAVAGRLAQLAAAQVTYDRVLAEKERYLSDAGDPRSRRLLDIAGERGRLNGEIPEIVEALDAADDALEALSRVRDALGNALGSSALDTLFGGRALSSELKHSLLDEATRAAGEADQRLAVLRTELLDVHDTTLTVPQRAIDGSTRFMDVWFDNVFADLAVHHRIKRAQHRVEKRMRLVTDVIERLEARAATTRETLTALETERKELLTG